MLYAEARLAFHTREENNRLDALKKLLTPWVNGEVSFSCNFQNYQCGGMASAWLLKKGVFPEAESAVKKHAEMLIKKAPRGEKRIFCLPRPPHNIIFIDAAFAVTPFLLFAGLYFEEEKWIEEAVNQTCKMVKLLRDSENGLLHQAKNYRSPGHMTQDHWSRGNGWGIFALTELFQGLPEDHPRFEEVYKIFRSLLLAIYVHQDGDACWHQEMTRMDSYVETSGAGLFLYAFARDPTFKNELINGLKGLSSYIALDGSIHNTSGGCLCPGEGTIEDYLARGPILNDRHAFGAISLAFGQASINGISSIPLQRPFKT